jgi:undecaprenyl-diphosphatase
MIADPWFSHWNHEALEALFRYIPHDQRTDDAFDLLIATPLLCTWFFAAFFYRLWVIDDEQLARRREYLFKILVAVGGAFLVTAVIRPWISWPAPVLNPQFQPLFPRYRWGSGTWNCFPSHSTLAYFTVAAGLWPLRRSLSIALSVLALACVSLPRVYLGGHYPIDVLFSCVLGVLALVAVSRWNVPAPISQWLSKGGAGTAIRDWLFFLWVFEFGEGFRGVEFFAGFVHHLLRR